MKQRKAKVVEQPAGSLFQFLVRYDFIILFVLFYLAYNTIDGVWLMSGDTAPASLLPYAILNNHNLYLDFATSYTTAPDFAYAFRLIEGHYVSLFPVVTPVLVTPVYALSTALSYFISFPEYGGNLLFFMSKSAASFLAALAGVLVYLSGKELFSREIALFTTLIFAFATTTWSISSQALWQQGTVELLLAALIYLMVKNERNGSWQNIFLMGIVSGLFIFNRPPDSLLLLPVVFYIIWYRRSEIHYYLTGGVLAGLPFLYNNYSTFGNAFGGYGENLSFFAINQGFIGHFLGLLISPNGGLFVFCPVLLLSVAGYYLIYKKEDSPVRTILLLFGVTVILEVILYGLWRSLSDSLAFSFGPRYMTALVPILCIFVGYFLDHTLGSGKNHYKGFTRGILITVITILVIISVCIQVLGVFFYMYSSPGNHTINDDRAWTAGDSVIVRSYIEGAGKAPGISVFVLPPIPPLIRYDF
ncbi:MAG: glycosyltransferase family 39 protein [Methanoregula sp.]|nr:glycosyltransferase family 39 protein [Methanoregula sp.]